LVSQNLTSDLNKPVGESFEFTNSNDIEIIGDKMYVSPLLFYAMSENPFKREKREYPIDFTFPIHEKHTISIEIPEGYAIESLPKSEGFAITENMASFRYVMNQSGNKIQVMIQEELNAPIISSEHYEDLKNYYQKVVDKHNEKIVLKRI
ncbi:MAG: transglutaminase, partial [Flavobacterium sp.]